MLGHIFCPFVWMLVGVEGIRRVWHGIQDRKVVLRA